MSKPSRSAIVKLLADVASQGTYQVQPKGARTMNQVFELAAGLINELEAEEKEAALNADTYDGEDNNE